MMKILKKFGMIQWREWASHLLPIALLCSFLNLVALYLVSYWISMNGISTAEVYLFLVIPTILLATVTSLVCYAFLKRYRIDCFEENKKPSPGVIMAFGLIATIFISGMLLDWIYFQVDPYLSYDFGQALSKLIISAGESKEAVDRITKLPLFTQNYMGIGIGIFIGVLVSVVRVTIKVKKPQHPLTFHQ